MYTRRILSLIILTALVSCIDTLPSKSSSLQYAVSNHSIPLLPANKENEQAGYFAAEIFIGSQVFAVGMDTGSSDTWVLATNANCTNVTTLQEVAPADCGFTGSRYGTNSSFEVIPDMHLNTSFINGAALNGLLGFTELVLGGLTVPKQEISPITYISAGGLPANNISGFAGLAYPSLTRAFPGTDPSKDIVCKGNSSCGPIPYSPLLTTIFNESLTEPVFAFALSRSDKFGGIMTIGGIPRLDDAIVNATQTPIASSPIKPLGNGTALSLYTTEVDGFVYSNAAPNAGQGQYFVDTGTMPNVFPQAQADAINALFDPPATYSKTLGYVVSCDARAPELGIKIDGKVFYHNPKDLILHSSGRCFSAIQGSEVVAAPILGATWLKSVLAIFDVGASEMKFASRMYYLDS